MEIEHIPLIKLSPAEYNPRKMSDKDREDLARSMKEFGVVEPLVVQKKQVDYMGEMCHQIIGGHQRYNCAADLHLGEVPCVLLDIDDTKAKLLNLTLNAVHGEFVEEKLRTVLEELRLDGADISLTGIDPVQLGMEMPSVGEEESSVVEPRMRTCPKCGHKW